MLLYKYRPISSFRFLADILLKKRLFASPYFNMNDPMEGFYLMSKKGKLDQSVETTLRSEKEKLRICSLSKWSGHPLLWSHYAEGHNGVAIGVEVSDPLCDVKEVQYVDRPLKINNYSPDSAKQILSHKLSAWSYESEVRVFVEGRDFVNITLREISLGSRLCEPDRVFLIDFCKKVCPEAKIIVAGTGYA